MTWVLSDVSDLQAGKTYYYDAKGNLISEEEYRKIVDPNGEPSIEPSQEKEGTEVAEPPEEKDIPAEDKQPVEAEADEEEAEEEDDGEIEAEAAGVQYRVEVSSETIFRGFERDTV
jgi:hypothetical protein